LLLVPFLLVDSWWRSGFAPVIPSACLLSAGLSGPLPLMRNGYLPLAACLALALFAANPNLLYLQTTAMTEPLFLCELIWAVLLLVEWYASLDSNEGRSGCLLWAIIAVLAAAVYTRYDGWILCLFGMGWRWLSVCTGEGGCCERTSFLLRWFCCSLQRLDGLQRSRLWRLAGLHARPLFSESNRAADFIFGNRSPSPAGTIRGFRWSISPRTPRWM
jgi:hypothetical protein